MPAATNRTRATVWWSGKGENMKARKATVSMNLERVSLFGRFIIEAQVASCVGLLQEINRGSARTVRMLVARGLKRPAASIEGRQATGKYDVSGWELGCCD